MKRILCLVAVLGALALGTNAVAGAFGAGNIVVLRVGDVSHAITNAGNTVFLDEYTTNSLWAAAGGFSPPTPVQSIQLPTTWVGRNGPLVLDGSSLEDGGLSLSTDGRFLLLAGFGPTIGQTVTQALSTTTTTGLVGQVARVVALVDGFGHIYTTTTQTNANENANAIHSAVSLDGTNIWVVGEGNATGGKYTTQGSMISTQVESLSRFNSRRFNIFNQTLYYSANHVLGAPTNTSVAVNPLGGSLPTSFVTSNFLYLAGVYGSSVTSSPAVGSPNDFVLFNLNGGSAPDTLYVADNTTNAPGEPVGKAGGVLKYCYIAASNAWVNFGYIYADQASGVTGVKHGTNVDLYITAGGTLTAVHLLYPYHDLSGFAGSPNDPSDPNGNGGDANGNSEPLASSSTINTRGIAFAPQGGDSGTISAGPAVISVGPPFGPYFSGPQGGPFSPTNGVTYSVANLGGSTTNFTVSLPGFNWLTATPSSGTLASGASTTVIMTPNANANAKAGGYTYTGNVVFKLGGAGGTPVASPLATLDDFAFFITPTSNYVALGEPGGPFAPANYVYTLTNVTSSALPWTAHTSTSWNTLSATSGTLSANTATNITVSINATANALGIGTYEDELVFTNVNANAALPTRAITLQVGFGFFCDFSTYSNGDVVGQHNWYNPSPGLEDNPYQIVDGVLAIPGGQHPNCSGGVNEQEPAQDIASMAVTDTTQFAYLGISMTVTSAPSSPNTWDFTILPTVPGGNVTINQARSCVSDTGSGHYKWWTHVNGFDNLVPGTIGRTYGTKYNVIIAEDIGNSNCWVFVDPPDGTTNSLFAMTPDTHDGPDVPGWAGPTLPATLGVGSIDIDNYCSGLDQAGFLVYKIAMSTNYTDVYNFLTQVATPPPTASFTAAPTSGAAPLTVNFTDTSSGSPTAWYWTFDGVNTSASQNPSFTYTTPGSYTAQLIASNAGGASSPATQTISVYDPYAWWRLSYYSATNTANGAPGADPYGTGMSNTNKFLAGFNTNSAAYLHIISVAKTNGSDVKVIFLGANGDSSYTPGIASRTNRLEYTVGTANGSYTTNNFSAVPGVSDISLSTGTGVGVITNFTDVGGATNKPSRYYRVRVLLP